MVERIERTDTTSAGRATDTSAPDVSGARERRQSGLKHAGGMADQERALTPDAQPGFDAQSEALRPGAGLDLQSFNHWVQSGLNMVDARIGLLPRPLAVDGVVGPQTRHGVMAFQKRVAEVSPREPKLTPSGRLGPDTTGALERAVGVPNPDGRPASPLPETVAAATQVPPKEVASQTMQGGAEATGQKAPEPKSAPEGEGQKGAGPETTKDEDTFGGVGEEVSGVVPMPPAEEERLAETIASDPAAGSDADLAARLEQARREIGLVKEKAFKGIPPHMPKKDAAKLEATLRAKHPGKEIREITVWFAADEASLGRLETYAQDAGMGSYAGFIARHGGGYAWCGSFVATHLQLKAKFTFRTSEGNEAKSTAGAGLASTLKSYDYFNYGGRWSGAWIRDPAIAPDAPAIEQYRPLQAWHEANGGKRQWLPVDAWRGNPEAVAKPGMVLFVKGDKARGDHITFVDRVESDGKGGWVIWTVEGNGPKVATQVNSYALPAKGATEIKAVARPAALDFDPTVEMIDHATWKQRTQPPRRRGKGKK
jgi:hypothetical protein